MIPVKKEILAHIFFAVLIGLICSGAKVRQANSDPQGTLLVSQAIIQHGTIKLDSYKEILPAYTYKIYQKNGHDYYYFPLGTSFFMVPFVVIANTLTFDMSTTEPITQAFLAMLISIASYVLLAEIAKLYLSPYRACITAFIFWGGTSFASTGSTGLWSHDMATLFALLSIHQLLLAKQRFKNLNSIFIGFCLFSAYFCRPTLAILAPVYLIAAATMNRQQAFKIAIVTAALLGLFVAFSFYEFQQPLPDYYMPQRLSSEHFWVALYGNLLSPARGLLIYSPFLIPPIFWLITSRAWINFRVELILLLWPVLHVVAISRFPHWWAGYSFGSRLMMDALPALFVLLLCYLTTTIRLTLAWSGFISLGFFSIWINVWQGVYNESTAIWNANPSIDQYPEYLFDWRYPQFLSTKKSLRQRIREHDEKHPLH